MAQQDKVRKFGPVEVLVLVFVCLFVLAIFRPVFRKLRFYTLRIQCKNNLSMIGKAMLTYAADYDGVLPRSGYGSISSCFYLLVKHSEVHPKTFVCPADVGTIEFNPADVVSNDKKLTDLWDFGREAYKHCSYAYHMPFGLYYLRTSDEPGMPVAADRNPWIGSPVAVAKDFFRFNPYGDRESLKVANAITHNKQGQNVVFLDGHVSFEDNPLCGIGDDNIYTFWDGGDIRRGSLPSLGSNAQDRIDSLLVNDSELHSVTGQITTAKQPKSTDSTDLKQTTVVATLDCPMQEQKNVIWCSTFQMTWDKLKNDIIGEPVKIPQAADLAARLNQAEFSHENLEAESFYATVGVVKAGIVEHIQMEMSRRFPSEPVPAFNELDMLPKVDRDESIVSYSYLKTDVGFKYPFYTREDAFGFENSSGQRINVTSFCDYSKGANSNEDLIREQVDILYYKYADQESAAEFAVDLCRHTSPYQVVLALVPRQEPLGEIVSTVERKISEFKQDSDYEILCKLRPASGNRPADRLIVPDVLYKLTNHFAELKGKASRERRVGALRYL